MKILWSRLQDMKLASEYTGLSVDSLWHADPETVDGLIEISWQLYQADINKKTKP